MEKQYVLKKKLIATKFKSLSIIALTSVSQLLVTSTLLSSYAHEPLPPSNCFQDVFKTSQSGNGKLDLLIVVDSLKSETQELAEHLSSLTHEIPWGSNYQIGFVRTGRHHDDRDRDDSDKDQSIDQWIGNQFVPTTAYQFFRSDATLALLFASKHGQYCSRNRQDHIPDWIEDKLVQLKKDNLIIVSSLLNLSANDSREDSDDSNSSRNSFEFNDFFRKSRDCNGHAEDLKRSDMDHSLANVGSFIESKLESFHSTNPTKYSLSRQTVDPKSLQLFIKGSAIDFAYDSSSNKVEVRCGGDSSKGDILVRYCVKPGPSGTPSPSPTGTPTATPSVTPTPTPIPTPTVTPTPTPTPTDTPTPTPTVTPTPTSEPPTCQGLACGVLGI